MKEKKRKTDQHSPENHQRDYEKKDHFDKQKELIQMTGDYKKHREEKSKEELRKLFHFLDQILLCKIDLFLLLYFSHLFLLFFFLLLLFLFWISLLFL